MGHLIITYVKSPPNPQQGGVGHNIDRCITEEDVRPSYTHVLLEISSLFVATILYIDLVL